MVYINWPKWIGFLLADNAAAFAVTLIHIQTACIIHDNS